MARPLLARGVARLVAWVSLGLALSGCGSDLATCEDQLVIRFDELVERDYILVLTVGSDVARVDCSVATYPTEKGEYPVAIDVPIEGTLEGEAACDVQTITLVGITPDQAELTLTYRLPGSPPEAFDYIQTEVSIGYEEVEAEDRTCRQADLVVDVGCIEGTECGGGAENDDAP